MFLNDSSIAPFTLLTTNITCSRAENKFCLKCVSKQSPKRNSIFLFSDQLAFGLHRVQTSNRRTQSRHHKRFFSAIPNMKFIALAVFLAICLAVGVDSASTQLTLNGNAHIQFYGARDEIWNGLSNGKIFVIIHFLHNDFFCRQAQHIYKVGVSLF